MEQKKIKAKANYELTNEDIRNTLNWLIEKYNNVELLRHEAIQDPEDTVTFETKGPDGVLLDVEITSDGLVVLYRKGCQIGLTDSLYVPFASRMFLYRDLIVAMYKNKQLVCQEEGYFYFDEDDEFDLVTSGDDEFERAEYDLKFND